MMSWILSGDDGVLGTHIYKEDLDWQGCPRCPEGCFGNAGLV